MCSVPELFKFDFPEIYEVTVCTLSGKCNTGTLEEPAEYPTAGVEVTIEVRNSLKC